MAVDRATGRRPVGHARWGSGPTGRCRRRPGGGVHLGGVVIAFDLADGRVAWRTALPGPAIGPPATDGAAVAVTWESMPATRRGRWRSTAPTGASGGRCPSSRAASAARPSSPSARRPGRGPGPTDGSVVVVVAGDIAAHGLDLADGYRAVAHRHRRAGSPEVPPLPLGDGEVLVAHRLAGLVLLDAGHRRRPVGRHRPGAWRCGAGRRGTVPTDPSPSPSTTAGWCWSGPAGSRAPSTGRGG